MPLPIFDSLGPNIGVLSFFAQNNKYSKNEYCMSQPNLYKIKICTIKSTYRKGVEKVWTLFLLNLHILVHPYIDEQAENGLIQFLRPFSIMWTFPNTLNLPHSHHRFSLFPLFSFSLTFFSGFDQRLGA